MNLDHRSGVAVTTFHSLETLMGLLSLTRRAGKDAAVAVTGASAAVTGAAYGAATGAVDGAIRGTGQGLGSGPRATPAAALVVAAVGAAGLVEWPVLLLASGAALVVRQLRHQPANPTVHTVHTENPTAALPAAQPGTPIPPAPNRVVADTTARKAAAPGKAGVPTKASAPRTSAAPRKTSTSGQATATRKARTPRKVTVTPAATSNREDRHVTPNPEGGWDVKAPEAERASDHKDTQAEAISRAEEITRNTGGQTVIHKTDGTTRE